MGADCVSVSMPTDATHSEACFKKNDGCGWKLAAGYRWVGEAIFTH